MSTYTMLIEKGKKEGKLEGKLEGEQIGIQKVTTEVVLNQETARRPKMGDLGTVSINS